MAQGLRTLSVLAEDLGSVSSIYVVGVGWGLITICLSSSRRFNTLSWPLWVPDMHVAQASMQATHPQSGECAQACLPSHQPLSTSTQPKTKGAAAHVQGGLSPTPN